MSGLARQTRHRNSSDELPLFVGNEPEPDKRPSGRPLLGASFRPALTTGHVFPIPYEDVDPLPHVVGPAFANQLVFREGQTAGLSRFLEGRFGIGKRQGAFIETIHLVTELPGDERLRVEPPAIDGNGADDGFEYILEEVAGFAATTPFEALPDLDPAIEAEQGGAFRQPLRPDEMGAFAGQITLIVVRKPLKEHEGDNVTEDRVAEKLETLVGAGEVGGHGRTVPKGPFEDFRVLEGVSENTFKLGEGVFHFITHAAMLLRPNHAVANPGEPHMDLFTVGPRPVNPRAAAASTEPFGG